MGVLCLFTCLSIWCALSFGRSVDKRQVNRLVGDDPSRSTGVRNKQNYKFNYVMKELFNEMNSAVAHIVARNVLKEKSKGNAKNSKVLVQKIKKILTSKDALRRTNNKTQTSVTEAIGVFRKVFNKVAGEIDNLYSTRKEDNESGKFMRGVNISTNVLPFLQTLKQFDTNRKQEMLYYEEGSGSETKPKMKSQGKGTVVFDDTEGSADGSGEGSSEESGSGSVNDVLENYVHTRKVKVVVGKAHEEIINFVARDGS